MKILFFLLISTILLASSNLKNIEKKIRTNKKVLTNKQKEGYYTKKKIEYLANVIKKEESELEDLSKKIDVISNDIMLNKLKLQKSKKKLKALKYTEKELNQKINNLQQKIVDLIIDKYSIILNKKFLEKESFDDIIKEEILYKILQNTKDSLVFSRINYLALLNKQRKNQQKQQNLQKYINEQMQKKDKLSHLLTQQQEKLARLNKSYQEYQKKLEQIVELQYQLNNILKKLNILKTKEILRVKEEKLKKQEKIERKKKLQKLAKSKISIKKNKKNKNYKEIKIASRKKFKDKIDLKVKSLGDSSRGIKVSKFRGRKTIAPLKSYKIIRGFGSYYDPIYKIKLFNDGLTLKSKIKNAKVYAVLKGKVVYAKQNAGILGNIIIIKHNGNLHTIYSHLDKISPTIKKGKWVKKGYVIGRVKEKLFFQVTRNNSYINPLELIK